MACCTIKPNVFGTKDKRSDMATKRALPTISPNQVECFGIADALMDAELIEITDQMWKELGIRDSVRLQLNSIGSPEARVNYRAALVDFLVAHKDQLRSRQLGTSRAQSIANPRF